MTSLLKRNNFYLAKFLSWSVAIALVLTSNGICQHPSRSKRIPAERGLTSAVVLGVWNLKLIEGELPKWTKDKDPHYPHHYEYRLAMHPYVVMDNGEFAIVNMDATHNDAFTLAVATPDLPTEAVRGTLIVPDADYRKMVKLRFEIPASEFDSDVRLTRTDKLAYFFSCLHSHYQGSLIKMSLYSMSGANWYRMQSGLRRNGASGRRPLNDDPTSFAYNFMDKDSPYHECIDLDILAAKDGQDKRLIALTELPKPAARSLDIAIDAKQRLNSDPLSASIPVDQWTVFFPNVHEAISTLQRFRNECSRFHWNANRGGVRRGNLVAADLPMLYEMQLALDSNLVSQELASGLAKSIAITGSDVSFSMGTDIALLIETDDAVKLNSVVLAHRIKVAETKGGCKQSEEELDGIRYHRIQNQDRSISSLQAVLDSRIVVTNSLQQLKRILEVHRSRSESMRDNELYAWLRQRYPVGETSESGLLVVTEPFVRRLATARWRIAAARRWVAAVIQKDLQARYLARELLDGVFDLAKESANYGIPSDQYVLVGNQIQHRLFGASVFFTPVIELPVDEVTEPESKAYQNWLLGYEGRASSLDPLGVQFKNSKDQFSADISIFPKTQHVNYFNLDLYLGSKIPFQSMTKVLFDSEESPKVLTWRNLFLLNELRSRIPKQDPVETFKQLTGRQIASVPGGHYRWNEQWQTMECSVLGCPGSSPFKTDQASCWERIKTVRFDDSIESNCNRIVFSVEYETGSKER